MGFIVMGLFAAGVGGSVVMNEYQLGQCRQVAIKQGWSPAAVMQACGH